MPKRRKRRDKDDGFIVQSFAYWEAQRNKPGDSTPDATSDTILVVVVESEEADLCVLSSDILLANGLSSKIMGSSSRKQLRPFTVAGRQIAKRLQRASGLQCFKAMGSELVLYKASTRAWYSEPQDPNDVILAVIECFRYALNPMGLEVVLVYEPHDPTDAEPELELIVEPHDDEPPAALTQEDSYPDEGTDEPRAA